MKVSIDRLHKPTTFTDVKKAISIAESLQKDDPSWTYTVEGISPAKIRVLDEDKEFVGYL